MATKFLLSPSLLWRARYGLRKVRNHIPIFLDYISARIGLWCIALIWRRCRRILLVLGCSLRRWNLNHIRGCGIRKRIVWIIISRWDRHVVIRPPEWNIGTSDNDPAKEKPECCAIRSPSSVVIPGITSIISSWVVVPAVIVSHNVAAVIGAVAATTVSSTIASSIGAVAPRAAVTAPIPTSTVAPDTAV